MQKEYGISVASTLFSNTEGDGFDPQKEQWKIFWLGMLSLTYTL